MAVTEVPGDKSLYSDPPANLLQHLESLHRMKNVFHAELFSTNKIGKNHWEPGHMRTPGDEVAGTCTF